VTLVLDTSAILKWVLNEEDSEKARRILDQYLDGSLELIAPSLVFPEVGNVLARMVRRGKLNQREARACFRMVLEYSTAIHDSSELYELSLELALEHHQSHYDCLFLALARAQKCTLVTADEKFFRGLRQASPEIQLLRDYIPALQLDE
jgi:predicted nucleic acid-binding protein